MRYIVRASLPLAEGRILDPFMGGGATIAAAEYVGYNSIGVGFDNHYYEMAVTGIPLLARLYPAVEFPPAIAPVPVVPTAERPVPISRRPLF
jgi:hypothetical protein